MYVCMFVLFDVREWFWTCEFCFTGTAATKQAVQLRSVGESEQRGDRAASQAKRLPASQRQGEV
jgi:hypothetical protein